MRRWLQAPPFFVVVAEEGGGGGGGGGGGMAIIALVHHRAFGDVVRDTFKFILDPGHPAKHVSSLQHAHNRDTAALNCTTNATLGTVLQQCGHTEAEVCTVCV